MKYSSTLNEIFDNLNNGYVYATWTDNVRFPMYWTRLEKVTGRTTVNIANRLKGGKTMDIVKQLEKIGVKYHGVTITNYNGYGTDTTGVMVFHDYNGLYPDKTALEKHNAVMNIARRAGLKAEQRGHYSATLIYTGGAI